MRFGRLRRAALGAGLAACSVTSSNEQAGPIVIDAGTGADGGGGALPDGGLPGGAMPAGGGGEPFSGGAESDAGAGGTEPDAGPPRPDADDDGVPDDDDNCPAAANRDQRDADGDGLGDACDEGDADGDGIPDSEDLCPNLDVRPIDTDGDRVGDQCDLCPEVPDPGQADRDADGLGDACEPCPDVPLEGENHEDGDGDGVPACAGDCDDTTRDVGPGADERCNDFDDDCDGQTDEGFPGLGGPCSAGAGACQRDGSVICAGEAATTCDAVPGAPAVEQCNELDDDCDGVVDEDLQGCCDPGETRACGLDAGECRAGRERCGADRAWGDCDGQGPVAEQCNGLDDDCDGATDEDFDLDTDRRHCGRCGNPCRADQACRAGRCAVSDAVRVCGRTARDASVFLRNEAAGFVLQPDDCTLEPGVHTMMITRAGLGSLGQGQDWRGFLEGGGIVVTESGTSATVLQYTHGLFPVAELPLGNCLDELIFARIFNRDDPFWRASPVPPAGSSGCGQGLRTEQVPGLVPLAGHTRDQVHLGYINVGAGRLWIVESDWGDVDTPVLSEGTLNQMAYMIAGGADLGGPQCRNALDDDADGVIDLNDPGCEDREDRMELSPVVLPACSNGLDDDQNGVADFPLDAGCVAAGDPAEAPTLVVPACSDGFDNDGDGFADFPVDYGCEGAGDPDEVGGAPAQACGDLVDNDADATSDYGRDPQCATNMDGSESF